MSDKISTIFGNVPRWHHGQRPARSGCLKYRDEPKDQG
jgi:hypothetical protein